MSEARGEEFEGGAGFDLLVAAGVHAWQVQEEAGLARNLQRFRPGAFDGQPRMGDLVG